MFLRSFVSPHGPLTSNLLIRENEISSIQCNAFRQAQAVHTCTAILVLLISDLHNGYHLRPSGFSTRVQWHGYYELINNRYIICTLYYTYSEKITYENMVHN